MEADRLAEVCRHDLPSADAPTADKLRIEVEAPAAGISSGATSAVWVRFRNISQAPLALQLEAGCGVWFDTRILQANGARADRENDVGGLGLCGTIPGIRVALEPGGVLSKRLEVAARAQRWAPVKADDEDSPLELVPASAIAPGTYTLEVIVPLYAERRAGHERQIHVTLPLRIVGN